MKSHATAVPALAHGPNLGRLWQTLLTAKAVGVWLAGKVVEE